MATQNKRFIAKNGVDNNGNTLTNVGTSGSSLELSGAYAVTLTTGGTTNVSLPTSGTLATLAGNEALANKTLTTPTIAQINATADHTIDAGGDIVLDADGADVILKDAGVQYGALTNSSGNLIIKSGTTTAITLSGADVTVAGNFTVSGTTTTINTTTLDVADKNITLAKGNTTDAGADGAGITVDATSAKTFQYDNANTAFSSNQNLNVASGKTYKINGTDVLSSTTLGSGVTSSSLTSVGTLGTLTVTGAASVGSLNAGSGAIQTTGTLSSGATTVTSLNAGSGAIQTTGTLSSGAATVTSLNAGSGALTAGSLDRSGALTIGATSATSVGIGRAGVTTTVSGTLSAGTTTVTSLNAGSGTIETTGSLSAGAATVTSLDAGSGAIQTTGTLSSGAATVTSLNAGSGSLTAGSLDRSGALTVGATSATSVGIGRAGITTTVSGTLSAGTTNVGALTATSLDRSGALTVGATSATSVGIGRAGITTTVSGTLSAGATQVGGTLTLDPAGTATAGTPVDSNTIQFKYGYYSGSAQSTNGYSIRTVPSSNASGVGDLGFFDASNNTTPKLTIKASTGDIEMHALATLLGINMETINLDSTSTTLNLGPTNATEVTIGNAASAVVFNGVDTRLNTFYTQPNGVAVSGAQTKSSYSWIPRYSYWNGSAAVTSPGFAVRVEPTSAAAGTGDLIFYSYNNSGGTSERVRFIAGGSVKVTTLNTGSIHTVYASADGTLQNSSSDARLKTNVETIEDGLARVKQLRPVRFDWLAGGPRDMGFIAQEAEAHVPEATWVGHDGMYGFEYAKVIALLTAAIKELSAEVDALKARLQ